MNIRELIKGNPYVGRGVIAGHAPSGKQAVAYFIMGRSQNSRNRVFVKDGDDVMIKPYDESKVEDPSLIIYYPVRTAPGALIVTNGDQTDTIRDFLGRGETFEDALRTREFEPDAPNYTPRISGLVTDDGVSRLSILRCADGAGKLCERFFFEYAKEPGTAHFIHTYVTDGDPLPSFRGEPEETEVPEDIEAFAEDIWEGLDPDNKISLYVRYTDPESGTYEDRLINKYE